MNRPATLRDACFCAVVLAVLIESCFTFSDSARRREHAETMAAIHALDLARQKDNEDRLHNQLEGLKVKRTKAVLPNWTASDEAEFRRKGDLR